MGWDKLLVLVSPPLGDAIASNDKNQNLKAVGQRFHEIYDVPWSMTLREDPKTPTQWKSESLTDQ